MRNLLLSALVAFGVAFTAVDSASATTSPGIAASAPTTKVSPRVRLAAKACREECDKNGNNCRQRCR